MFHKSSSVRVRVFQFLLFKTSNFDFWGHSKKSVVCFQRRKLLRVYSRPEVQKEATATESISFLIFAIARPGFEFLGHVFERFIIVWHLYNLNGSCLDIFERFSVALSRVSIIQR